MNPTDRNQRRKRLKKIITYRSWFGSLFSGVGVVLFVVGLRELHNPMILINGALFAGYGLFMIWQSRKALKNLR